MPDWNLQGNLQHSNVTKSDSFESLVIPSNILGLHTLTAFHIQKMDTPHGDREKHSENRNLTHR